MMLPAHLYDDAKAEKGFCELEWARKDMPVLWNFVEKYKEAQPLGGIKIGGCVHITKETGNLVLALNELGAHIAWAGCNPFSTKNDIVSALLKKKRQGITVYGWHGQTEDEYVGCIDAVCRHNPLITVDDGADLVSRIHEKHPLNAKQVIGGTEETTTGVNRLLAMEAAGELLYPVIAVNNAWTKRGFDNYFGTGQSTLDGIIRATDLLVCGKIVIVAGYGQCGKGIASRARGLGAQVVVTETSSVRALEAAMEGYNVMTMEEAAAIGDVFITVIGNRNIITFHHMGLMKDGAYLANTGHFDLEIDMRSVEKENFFVKEIMPVRENVKRYRLFNNRNIYILADGRLVNLAAAKGHPSSVMDMSFSNQLLAVLDLVQRRSWLPAGVHPVAEGQDDIIADAKLKAMGIRIDTITKEQEEYQKWY